MSTEPFKLIVHPIWCTFDMYCTFSAPSLLLTHNSTRGSSSFGSCKLHALSPFSSPGACIPCSRIPYSLSFVQSCSSKDVLSILKVSRCTPFHPFSKCYPTCCVAKKLQVQTTRTGKKLAPLVSNNIKRVHSKFHRKETVISKYRSIIHSKHLVQCLFRKSLSSSTKAVLVDSENTIFEDESSHVRRNTASSAGG